MWGGQAEYAGTQIFPRSSSFSRVPERRQTLTTEGSTWFKRIMGKRKVEQADALNDGVEKAVNSPLPDMSEKESKGKNRKEHKKENKVNKKEKKSQESSSSSEQPTASAAQATHPDEKGNFDSDLASIFASAAASAPAFVPPAAAAAQKNRTSSPPQSSPQESQEATAPESGLNLTPSDDKDGEGLTQEQLAAFREELGLAEGEMPPELSPQNEDDKEGNENAVPKRQPKKSATKTAPLTPEERQRQNLRTIFLGNIPLSALTSRGLQRDLRTHLVSYLPGLPKGAIESIRFRSIPLSVPTGDYTLGGAKNAAEAATMERKNERTRLHRQKLAQADLEEKGLNPNAVQYLRPSQKRKIAAIKQDVNSQASSCNAYVVLHPAVAWMVPEDGNGVQDEPEDEEDRNSDQEADQEQEDKSNLNVKASKSSLSDAQSAQNDPNTSKRARLLAAVLAQLVDGSLFGGKHLRADLTIPFTQDEIVQAQASVARASRGEARTSHMVAHLADILTATLASLPTSGTEPKETIFVGNLDFAASDEDLRAFFEGLVSQERGAPRGTKSWVKSVRIVRDRATQMGKGFAYVRFVDEASVDEVMALWEADQARIAAAEAAHRKAGAVGSDGRSRPSVKTTVKFMKRKLRLARCKTTPGGGSRKKNGAAANQADHSAPHSPVPATPARGRSTGAPTPGGTSPWERSNRPARRQLDSSPTRAAAPATSSDSPSATPTLPIELGSKAAFKEAKKNDPERQAKRRAKKQKKLMERSLVAATGSTSGKIPLRQGRRSKASKPGQGNKKGLPGRKPAPTKKAGK